MSEKYYEKSSAGYVLVEALVAVLIVSLGILALSKLESMIISSAGEARERTAAMALARDRVDRIRNAVRRGHYESVLSAAIASCGSGAPEPYGVFEISCSVSPTDLAAPQHLFGVNVTWLDTVGNIQQVNLHTMVAWSDSAIEATLFDSISKNLITPTGSAVRRDGTYRGGPTAPSTDNSTKITKITDAEGKTILELPPVNGGARVFKEIHGRIYFDKTVNNGVPDPANVFVRLSSEGECIYDESPLAEQGQAIQKVINDVVDSNGQLTYQYFKYTCFVGPGWYGSVGVTFINGEGPTVCVGSSDFLSNANTTTSPHPRESITRTYRGFKSVGQTFLSTGVNSGPAYYGKKNSSDVNGTDGRVMISSNQSAHYKGQDFLLTNATGQKNCGTQLGLIGTVFSNNVGKYNCINPDDATDGSGDKCPAIWTGFESEIGSSGGGSCTAVVEGSQYDAVGAVTASIDGGAPIACSKQGGSKNYTCNLAWVGGQTSAVSVTLVSQGSKTKKVSGVNVTTNFTCTRSGELVPCAATLNGINIDNNAPSSCVLVTQ